MFLIRTFPPRPIHQLVYGLDATQAVHIRRLMRMVTLYVVAQLLLWIAVLEKLSPAWSAYVLTGYNAAGSMVFYGLLRSGASRLWRDPSLAYAQLLFGFSCVGLSYGLISEVRSVALQSLCLMLAFEMDRIPSIRLMRASVLAVGMLACSALARWVTEAQEFQLITIEVYNVLMVAVLLSVTILVGGEVRRLYQRHAEQGEALALTLHQLNELSTRDALTGLHNRRHMMVLLDREYTSQRRVVQAFCVAILDIDWFKRINDVHGHAVGDIALQQFSRVVSSALSPADTLARWGGEEFLLLMPASTEGQAMAILVRVQRAIAAHDWASHAPGLQLTFSAGVAEYAPTEALDRTLERADQALYRAKHEGRNCAVAADGSACRDMAASAIDPGAR